jgi:hypothetical protein
MSSVIKSVCGWLKQWPIVRRAYRQLYAMYWSYRTTLLETLRTLWFPATVRHVSGPTKLETDKDDLVVTCLVYNGAPYLEEFIDHYQSLGATHLVFLDNGSTDDTVALARSHDNTTVLRSEADFTTYQVTMRRYLLARFSGPNWVLYVDIDEFFDYPYSRDLSLRGFIQYLNSQGFNAVPLQMLDMFPGGSISEVDASDSLRASHVYYDLSNISQYDYASNDWLRGNMVSNPAIKTHRGGARQELFEMQPDRPLLTKHMLLRFTENLRPSDVRLHHVDNALIADVSCVLYHYKFKPNFLEYAQRAVEEGVFRDSTTQEYHAYVRTLTDEDAVSPSEQMKRLEDTQELVERGFLQVSDRFLDHVAASYKQVG